LREKIIIILVLTVGFVESGCDGGYLEKKFDGTSTSSDSNIVSSNIWSFLVNNECVVVAFPAGGVVVGV